MNTRAFCRKTGERRPEDEDEMALQQRPALAEDVEHLLGGHAGSSSRLAGAAPLEVGDRPGLGDGRPAARADSPGGQLERRQHIGELGEVAHLDLEDQLVEIGRDHAHHQIVDVGLAGRQWPMETCASEPGRLTASMEMAHLWLRSSRPRMSQRTSIQATSESCSSTSASEWIG